jgi:hypothetical protein
MNFQFLESGPRDPAPTTGLTSHTSTTGVKDLTSGNAIGAQAKGASNNGKRDNASTGGILGELAANPSSPSYTSQVQNVNTNSSDHKYNELCWCMKCMERELKSGVPDDTAGSKITEIKDSGIYGRYNDINKHNIKCLCLECQDLIKSGRIKSNQQHVRSLVERSDEDRDDKRRPSNVGSRNSSDSTAADEKKLHQNNKDNKNEVSVNSKMFLPELPGVESSAGSQSDENRSEMDDRSCHSCGQRGHIKRNCPQFRRTKGTRARKENDLINTNLIDKTNELKGINDANIEMISDLKTKIKELEKKKPIRELPDQDKLLDNDPTTLKMVPFDNKSTVVVKTWSAWPVAICLLFFVLLAFNYVTDESEHSSFYSVEMLRVLFITLAWTANAVRYRSVVFQNPPTLRYSPVGALDLVFANDRRDPSTKGNNLLFTDPQMQRWEVVHLKVVNAWSLFRNPFMFFLTGGGKRESIVEERFDEFGNSRFQIFEISAKLFELIRNPRVVSDTSDKVRVYERMVRFAESLSYVNINHEYESVRNVRAATIELAMAHLFGYWTGTNNAVTHRYEPGDLKEIGPPR